MTERAPVTRRPARPADAPAQLAAAEQGGAYPSRWTFQANEGVRRFSLRDEFCEGARTEGENAEGFPDVPYLWAAAVGGQP